jgi:hypothetical protein
MNYIKNLPKIKKMARRVGTPLKAIDFRDGGVTFTFVVESETVISFPDADEGVEKVIGWLNDMLPEEFKLKENVEKAVVRLREMLPEEFKLEEFNESVEKVVLRLEEMFPDQLDVEKFQPEEMKENVEKVTRWLEEMASE